MSENLREVRVSVQRKERDAMVETPFVHWLVLTLFIAIWLAVVFFLPPPKNLWTVEHDGHKWIQWNSGLNVQTMHHPDCCCGVAKSD